MRARAAIDRMMTGAAGAGVYGVLVGFAAAQRCVRPCGRRAEERTGRAMAWTVNRAVRLAGARLRVEGLQNVEPERAHLVVANHESVWDVLILLEHLAALRPRYVVRSDIVRCVPGLMYLLRRGGSVCIDVREPREAAVALERLARGVREEGFSVVLFPESRRVPGPGMRPFHVAVLRTLCAKVPGIPVLPVTLSGPARACGPGLRPVARVTDVLVAVHPSVVPPDPRNVDAFERFVRGVEQSIRSALPLGG